MIKQEFNDIKKYLAEKYKLNEDDFIIFHNMGYYTANDRALAQKMSEETNGTILYKFSARPKEEFWTIRWWIERE